MLLTQSGHCYRFTDGNSLAASMLGQGQIQIKMTAYSLWASSSIFCRTKNNNCFSQLFIYGVLILLHITMLKPVSMYLPKHPQRSSFSSSMTPRTQRVRIAGRSVAISSCLLTTRSSSANLNRIDEASRIRKMV